MGKIKTNNNCIIFKLPVVGPEMAGYQMGVWLEREFTIIGLEPGKLVKQKDCKALQNKNLIWGVYLGPEKKRLCVQANVTLELLEVAVKKAKTQIKKFGRGAVNLSPDLHLWVTGK